MKAANLKTGMIYYDGSVITVLSETKHYINVLLSGKFEFLGKSSPIEVDRKWKKTSDIKLASSC